MNTWTFGPDGSVMVFPLELPSVAHRGYLLIDTKSRTAVAIDPPPDADRILDLAARRGARLRHIFLTKFHSDFEGSHLRLAERSGAVIYVGAWGRPDYDHLPVKDGDVLQFGQTSLRILETPGHVLEGLTIVAADPSDPKSPWGVFPGDLLFEDDIARPEPRRLDGYSVPDLAEMLYDSLHGKLLQLPGETRLFSGHARAGSDAPCLALVRRGNPLLRPVPRKAFVDALTIGRLPSPLMDGTRNALNRWSPRGSGIVYPNPLPFLEPRDFLAIVDHGAQPIDLREPMEFAASHLKGSLSLGLGADFEAWASSLLDPTHEYVLICNAGSEPEASLRLRPLLGFRMRGVLAGGMSAMEAFPERLDFLDARRRRARRLDVRPAVGGRRSQHRFPLEELLGRLDELPPAAEALDVCDLDPQRALSTASLLRRLGWANARPLPTPPRAARARILGS